ncbi:serine/threonine protein kinase [Rhodopirellula sp. JC740]|uniref:Serine/threonine protein kinase n=1 Tax=Rhodopirellula halodulae TaxID=2894198 RepID=A0ABS8NR69_9BACT|nr:serine/threonine-protein kinase [Rhodopirellula sp. JC740]MCC9645313.1 serine/threonine protein kinase [Rhodopirellula sp. JC740]
MNPNVDRKAEEQLTRDEASLDSRATASDDSSFLLSSIDTPKIWSVQKNRGHLGGYELLREIGRGGFGIVYLARDQKLNREVAIKIARPEIVSDPIAIRRFQDEARAAASLEHPGIISIYDCGVQDDLHYYVMPYLDGEHLGSWLEKQEGPLPEAEAAEWMIQIASAVQFGHDAGIVHRDLKPQNIFMQQTSAGGKMKPVVLDFGLCASPDSTVATTTMIAGTPKYIAPEQAMFGNRKITPMSDVYSLGVILYQMLTGKTPLAPESFAEAVLMLHHSNIDSPKKHQAGLSDAMEAIVLKCLRRDPDLRYESVHALAEDLQRLLDGRPVEARRPSVIEWFGYELYHGSLEKVFGWAVIGINLLIWGWAGVGGLLIWGRFPNEQQLVETIPEFLLFVVVIVMPLHLIGGYSGWMMIQRTLKYRWLAFMGVLSLIWSVVQASNLFSDQSTLSIYEGRVVASTLVFLVIAPCFFFQGCMLLAGAWTAWRRRRALLKEQTAAATSV